MANSVTIAARVSRKVENDLNEVAKAMGRSRSWLVAQAVEQFVENERQFIEAVKAGESSSRTQPLHDHDTILADIERMKRRRKRRSAAE